MPITPLDEKTALIVVDLQNAIRGFPYPHSITEILDRAGELARAFRARDLPVVVTTANSVGATRTRTDTPFQAPSALPAGWDEPVVELDMQAVDHRVVKQQWGSFTNTDLEQHLRSLGVTEVVIVGVATAFGVESTARNAVELGFTVALATDVMTDLDLQTHTNSIARIFPRLGECGTAADILDQLNEKRNAQRKDTP